MARKDPTSICIVFPVSVPGQGRPFPPAAAELKASLGMRPMALAEVAKESDRPCLAILSDGDDLLARVGQLAARCGLRNSPGAIVFPGASRAAAPGDPGGAPTFPHVGATLVSGPRSGFEKMLEVLVVSGDPWEASLARSGDQALSGSAPAELRCGERSLAIGGLDKGRRPLLMGILNVTPDSFSDGGRWADPDAAAARGIEMEAEGADLIDVGGESTRPGAAGVDAEEESRRVLPVIERLAATVKIPISIDTTKAEVARRAIGAGAAILNDVSGLRIDPRMPAFAASVTVPVVLNHLRGVPRTMQESPSYDHVVIDVLLELAARVRVAREAGVAPSRIVVDPGFGFGKRVEDNLALLRHLRVFRSLGCPILVGVSRKSFLGAITGRAVAGRLPATLAAETLAAIAGADIVRTHEPGPAADAMKVAQAIAGSPVNH